MVKFLLVVFIILALLAMVSPAAAAPNPNTCSGYPEKRTFLESQAWWAENGFNIPSTVGHHVHVGACFPDSGQILNGTLHLDFHVVLHEVPSGATAARFRGGLEDYLFFDNTGSTIQITRDSQGNGEAWFGRDINLTNAPTGRHEFRVSYMIDYTVNGQARRQFQSTGWQICIRSCSPTYRSGEHYEARGWYTAHDYANAKLSSVITNVVPGATVNVALKPGSGGLPTVFSGVYLDPNFHSGNAGTVLLTRNSAYTGPVTIPNNLATGTHKLVLLSHDGKNAGVQVINFVVGGLATPTPVLTPTPTPVITPTPSPTC